MSSLTRSGARSSSAASSSSVAGRPRRASSPARSFWSRARLSAAWTGQADGAARVGDAALDRLTDPPGGVRGELEALAPVELLDRVDEAEVALLDQVEERHARRLVALGDRHDQSEVRLHELALGVLALADERWRSRFSVRVRPLSTVSRVSRAALPASMSWARRASSSLVSSWCRPMSSRYSRTRSSLSRSVRFRTRATVPSRG